MVHNPAFGPCHLRLLVSVLRGVVFGAVPCDVTAMAPPAFRFSVEQELVRSSWVNRDACSLMENLALESFIATSPPAWPIAV